jgi:monoamine oxidase/SAM-dependent methyltransferase
VDYRSVARPEALECNQGEQSAACRKSKANMDNPILAPVGRMNAADPKPFRVAIIGGGPGGLFTAWQLASKAGPSCQITVFEATGRLGGKLKTGQFPGVGPYEAGVAEIYDYSSLGPDPLHDLIVKELGLEIKPIQGRPCVLDGKLFIETDDLAKSFGERTRDEAVSFRKRCAELLSPEAYYFSVAEKDNAHPWAKISGAALLEREFTDDHARRYIRAMAHSDVAAAPHHTNGLTFLKNVLMDVGGYMDIVSVVGGNEQIVSRLAEDLDAEIRLNANVTAVEPLSDGTYRLEMLVNGFEETVIADYVVVALPLSALSTVHWRSEALDLAMERHAAYFDRPGHYLRATYLFQRPFWRQTIAADWWMLDAFDGCCVYDESARYDYSGYGVLAFLIAGNAALALVNDSDEQVEQMCLDALPAQLAHGKELLLDRRIHRWVASVSAIPGGVPVRPRAINHRPDPVHTPGLVMVGDYLFDSTINGVMDSSEMASDIILTDVLERRHPQPPREASMVELQAAALNEALEHVAELMSVKAIVDVLNVTWGLERGAKLLHVGSASGYMVAALRALGFDATGVECSRGASLATPAELTKHNFCCDFAHLPFENEQFDAVIETGLYRTAPDSVENAVRELHRVTRHGVLLGSVTTDLTIDVIERFNLLEDVRVLCSRWDWSEKFYAAGFVHALYDRRVQPFERRGRGSSRLGEAWERAQAPGGEPSQWYEDPESLLYSVYERASKPDSPRLKQALAADEKNHDQDPRRAQLIEDVQAGYP